MKTAQLEDAYPIIFTVEMVNAILEGRKVVTRRVMRYQPVLTNGLVVGMPFEEWYKFVIEFCPYGKPGSLMLVGYYIYLRIEDVRVEKVQEITHAGAIAEGCPIELHGEDSQPIAWFASRWDDINAKRGYSWQSNPWVWVIRFSVENILQ